MRRPTLRSLSLWRGVAALEFAILLVPMVAIGAGMTDLGRAFYQYNGLVKSTRDAARYLSMVQRGDGEATARSLAVYGTAATGDAAVEPLVHGLTTGMVKIRYQVGVQTGYGAIDLVTVSVEGFLFAGIVSSAVGSFEIGPIATTMRQGGS